MFDNNSTHITLIWFTMCVVIVGSMGDCSGDRTRMNNQIHDLELRAERAENRNAELSVNVNSLDLKIYKLQLECEHK